MLEAIVPSQDIAIQSIQRANLADTTKAQYVKALRNYLATGASLTDAAALANYAQDLKQSSRAFLKSAVRIVSLELEQRLKSGADPENVQMVQAAVMRLEALREAVQVQKPSGTKAHLWLDRMEVKDLMTSCGSDLAGRRDWIVLALLVGAGLRRTELAGLRFSDLKEQPVNGRKRTVIEIEGKGSKQRLIPISDKLAARLETWRLEVGGGLVARSLGRKQEMGESLSTIGIFAIVRKHGQMIDKPELAPHDLRRTYAQLGYEAGVPLTQISKLLGHATIATTQKYLNLELDLETTISDFIPL